MKNESKHTPGPWRLGKKVPFGLGGEPGLFSIYGGDETEARGPSSIVDCIGEPNASLIAAAPEMLEALEAVAYGLEHSQGCVVPNFLTSAINKAKGL